MNLFSFPVVEKTFLVLHSCQHNIATEIFFFFFLVGAMTVIYKASFFFSLESFTTEKDSSAGVEQSTILYFPARGTPRQRETLEIFLWCTISRKQANTQLLVFCKCNMKIRVMFFLLGFEASMSALTLFIMPVCCRNARCKGNRAMPSLAWLCNYCRLSCTLCWWATLCLKIISCGRTVWPLFISREGL